MSFAVGATVEQRYPGATQEAARMAAVQRIAAFEAAGWAVADERWESGTTSTVNPIAAPKYAAQGGTLIITFVAQRPADVPLTLSHLPVEPDDERSPMTRYAIRLVVILVVFVILLALILAVGGPIVTTLMGGSPKPIGG